MILIIYSDLQKIATMGRSIFFLKEGRCINDYESRMYSSNEALNKKSPNSELQNWDLILSVFII
ncbi:hypothetical protein QLS91_06620 [Flavobacterium sp. LB2P84]|uniref:hypothetical protein n=1 Tax=Flavobacterium yafengii TaxID=3041253 RepID=UPI0024A88A97|nr:hypothetical protein [Flavobacterium yafengii]MDI6032742.1 hypothetical protein [Flavobacterium yafengii]